MTKSVRFRTARISSKKYVGSGTGTETSPGPNSTYTNIWSLCLVLVQVPITFGLIDLVLVPVQICFGFFPFHNYSQKGEVLVSVPIPVLSLLISYQQTFLFALKRVNNLENILSSNMNFEIYLCCWFWSWSQTSMLNGCGRGFGILRFLVLVLIIIVPFLIQILLKGISIVILRYQ